MTRRFKAWAVGAFDSILNRAAALRGKRVVDLAFDESVLKEGHLFIDAYGEGGELVETIDLGKNTLTYPFRVIVAKVLARKAVQVPSGAAFPLGIDGYDYTDDVFPVRLYVGLNNTPAQPTDTTLAYYLTDQDAPGGVPLYFDLARVEVRNTQSDYAAVSKPIHVAFEFDIPLGTMRSGGAAESSPYLLEEFSLVAGDGANHPVLGPADGSAQTPQTNFPTQLARKVTSVLKNFDMSYTLRWEIRT